MKIIIFDDEKNVIEEIPRVKEATPYGEDEVKWLGGGATIENHYIITEEETELENVTEEEIQHQRRIQTKITLARIYEEKRVIAMANGKEAEAEQAFIKARAAAEEAEDQESLYLAKQNFESSADEWTEV